MLYSGWYFLKRIAMMGYLITFIGLESLVWHYSNPIRIRPTVVTENGVSGLDPQVQPQCLVQDPHPHSEPGQESFQSHSQLYLVLAVIDSKGQFHQLGIAGAQKYSDHISGSPSGYASFMPPTDSSMLGESSVAWLKQLYNPSALSGHHKEAILGLRIWPVFLTAWRSLF